MLPKASPNLKNPVHLLAFGFGSGLFPKAPGTAGTVAAIIPWLWLAQQSLQTYVIVLVVSIIAGIYICDKTSSDMGVHDHGGIVWDEFCGLWITLFAIPFEWMWILAGFVLFRLFDILKPWPISFLDKNVGGGFGIMVDDVLAGIFAVVILQTVLFFYMPTSLISELISGF